MLFHTSYFYVFTIWHPQVDTCSLFYDYFVCLLLFLLPPYLFLHPLTLLFLLSPSPLTHVPFSPVSS